MNLGQWGVLGNANCSNAGSSQRGSGIAGSAQAGGTLNGSPPGTAATYVCVDTGHSTSDWQDLYHQSLDYTNDPIKSTKLFPVNYCGVTPAPQGVGPGRGQVDSQGVLAPCPLTPDKYDIIGFTILLIEHVYQGDNPLAWGVAGSSNSGCQKSGVDWPASSPMNLNTVLAGGANVNNKCPSSAPDTIPYASVHVFRGRSGNSELTKG